MAIDLQVKLDLADRLNQPQAFDLLNMRKGVPLIYKATLRSIDQNSVKFEVEPPSSVCLSWDSHTLILNDTNATAIKARVVEYDVISGIVQLTDLTYVDHGIGSRTSIRVEPDEVIRMEIRRAELTITGEITDISLTGFGIHVTELGEPPLQISDKVRMIVELMGQPVSPLGTIIGIRKAGALFRLAIRFTEDITIPMVIARYVIHRRAEIHREIRNAYYTAYTRSNPNKAL